jgi:hypothetical protein
MTNKLQVEYLIAYDGNSGTRVQITLSLLETSGWNAHDLLPHIDEQDVDHCLPLAVTQGCPSAVRFLTARDYTDAPQRRLVR